MATPQELASAARCFDCGLDVKSLLAIAVYELRSLAGLDSMTPAQLAEASKCFNCGQGIQDLLAGATYLLDQVTGGGAGGVLREVYTGDETDPNGIYTPNDPTKPAIYYPTGGGTGGTLFQWEVSTQQWV